MMYYLPTEAIAFICIGLVMIAAGCYAFGYQTGDHHNRYVMRRMRDQLRQVEKQKRELGKWVRENWPNELAAFENGHSQGYQQGFDHAHILEYDEEDAA